VPELCMHATELDKLITYHSCQGYLSRQAVAYEHFQAVRADDGDSQKVSLAASGELMEYSTGSLAN
jgi:hypothetical protein